MLMLYLLSRKQKSYRLVFCKCQKDRYPIGMSDFIRIQKDGFHEYSYDPDRRAAHIVRKNRDGSYSVLKKNTRELVGGEFFTEEEAENWFYNDDGLVSFILPKLRERITIASDVTIGDIARITKENEVLDSMADELFPMLDWWCRVINDGITGSGETVTLVMQGTVEVKPAGPRQLIVSHLPMSGSLSSPVELSENMFLYHDGTRHMGRHYWSLMDVLLALFGYPPETLPKVILDKNGIVDEEGEKMTLLDALLNFCDIKEGTTMLDLFRLVESEEMVKLFFLGYSWCWEIDAFHKLADKVQKHSRTKFNYCEVYAAMDVEIRDNEKDNKLYDFNLWHGFHVNGDITDEERKENPDWYEGMTTQNYGVSMTPINEYAHLPIKLDKNVTIEEYRNDLRKQVHLVESTRDLTLLEILDAIYYEISFVGGPEDQEKFVEEMGRRLADVKSGEEKTRPFDEIVKECEEKNKIRYPVEQEDGTRIYEDADDMMKEWEEEYKKTHPTEEEE